MFYELFKADLDLIETYLRSVMSFPDRRDLPQLTRFFGGLDYSVFSEGKRFRPLLAVLTARSLGHAPERVLPLVAAVELVHTYSLIHDDLPCMDDDDYRRGKPTAHKVYGEANALLAGDALLTMAFGILAQSPSSGAATAVSMLSNAAGPTGMVGGQVLDIESEAPSLDLLKEIHARKTGRLIRVSCEAAAVLCQATVSQVQALGTFGEKLGLAFQLADDLQDFDENNPEKVSYVTTLGIPVTLQHLQDAGNEALKAIADFPIAAHDLREMVRLNFERV